jgi:uncharacterized protein YndB with AHSA1/START domain
VSLALIVRRRIQASAARLFEAWIRPELLVEWWGPRGVRCSGAEVEPHVGGKLRIGNQLPDGRTLWIQGRFLEFVPGERLVYTWRTDPPSSAADERVTVRFDACSEHETEVIVIHERITEEAVRTSHERGWQECLDGLARFLAAPA